VNASSKTVLQQNAAVFNCGCQIKQADLLIGLKTGVYYLVLCVLELNKTLSTELPAGVTNHILKSQNSQLSLSTFC